MREAKQQAQDLLDFIDASPSPWHVIATIEQRLANFGCVKLAETEPWQLQAGGRYYTVRDGSSIVIFVLGERALPETGFKIIGAHTDSPGLRLKPATAGIMENWLRLSVDIYGSPILATFTDRDLSLAGRISHNNGQGGVGTRLIRFDEALLRLPNLPIHLNRSVNDDGLKLQKHNELPLLLANVAEEQLPRPYFTELLQRVSGIAAASILSWDLNVYDTQKGAFWGGDQEFIADSQLDNLASCHAALTAFLDALALPSEATWVCAFFDHEEVGSESHIGADGSFLPDVLSRVAAATGTGKQEFLQAMARSFLVSADMAHAYQPNFPSAFDDGHKVTVNQGPVIKVNAGQRYSSESVSSALFASWCQQAKVPYQSYSHRCDMPCGSTIGPITSAKLGIRSVDVGNPMWAMHSLRESAGVLDHHYLIKVLHTFLLASRLGGLPS